MIEEWKWIAGFEGLYEVSNNGNIRSVDRVQVQRSSHGTMIEKTYRGAYITPTDNGNGYLIVGLRKNGKRKSCYVHRLVAEAFIPNPKNLGEVNHKDFNKANNIAENLEWTDRLGNVLYSRKNMEKPRTKTKPTSTGERYITKKGNRWRLNIQRKSMRVDMRFRTLDEAIAAKVVMIGD